MKKLWAVLLAVAGLSLLAGCNNLTGNENAEGYGSIVVSCSEDSSDDSRKINTSELTVKSLKVYGYKMDTITGTVTKVSDGVFNVETINSVPAGRRVIEVVSNTGAKMYAWVDVLAGKSNKVSVNWKSTAVGAVYFELLKTKEIKNIDTTAFSSAIDTEAHASLIDAASIAADYTAGSLGASSKYVKSGTVTATVYGYSGKTLQIADPASSTVTVTTDGQTVEFSNVTPGTWSVYDAEGNKIGSAKITAGANTITIGNPCAGKTIVFVKTDYSKIYIWGATNNTEYAGAWIGSDLTDVPAGYMTDPTGWKYFDLTSAGYLNNEAINFIVLNNANDKSGDIKSGKTATFWWDGTDFHDSDPTEDQISSDATLKSISVNGTSVGTVSETVPYEIGSKVTSAAVTAETNDSKASYTVSPEGETAIAEGATKEFTITVTAEDGTEKTYTVNVTRKEAVVDDVTLASVTVNGSAASGSGTSYTFKKSGTADSLTISSVVATANDSYATVTYSTLPSSVADKGSESVTITVTNGSKPAVYTLTISYTKVDPSTSSYYWTNKNGAVGSNKTISSWSDWTEAERIAQCAAYDDPRTWKGKQEVPYDVYALYAAYDDTNLYIMAELTNIADRASFMGHDYAGSDNAWWNNRNCPLGFILNTGKGATATSPALENNKGVIWDAINFSDSEGFDWLFYGSSKFGIFAETGKNEAVGTPGFFHVKDTGYFSYDDDYCLSANTDTKTGTSGITVRFMRQCAVSKTIYYESTPTMNREASSQDGAALMASTTYSSCETGNLDMSYWYTVPLSTLGITKAYLESTGIGVRQITPNGGSLMDCCPWDVSMVDVATEACSDDESTSKEKEDVDTITSAQARVGHM